MTEAQEMNRQRLAHSAEKLLELLALNAPPQIVCGQVSQIFSQALMAYGEVLYAQLGKSIRESKLVSTGYCLKCECYASDAHQGHCTECWRQIEAEGARPSLN